MAICNDRNQRDVSSTLEPSAVMWTVLAALVLADALFLWIILSRFQRHRLRLT